MNFVLRRRDAANTAGGGCVQHVHPLVMVTDAVDAVAAQAPKTGQVQPRSCPFRKNLCDSSPPHPGPQLPPAHPSDLACKPDTRWPARRSTTLALTVCTFKIRVLHTNVLLKWHTLGGSGLLCCRDGVAVSEMVGTTT